MKNCRASGVTLVALAVLGVAGCLSPEAVRKIEEGPEGAGIMFSRLPAVIKILATYEATPAQQAQARAAVAQVQARYAAAPAAPPVAAPTVEPAPTAAVAAASSARAEPPRYIAVPVEADTRKQGEAQVMIWDTHSSEFIDNNVYDAATKPQEGVEMQWETSSATLAVVYLGEGGAAAMPGI